MSTAGTKPCPYCGEAIKANAVKCRFCGEFLQEAAPAPVLRPVSAPMTGQPVAMPAPAPAPVRRDVPDVDDDEGMMSWFFPIGTNLWAMLSTYMGILALLPFWFIAWVVMADMKEDGTKAFKIETMIKICCGGNFLFGLLAMIMGIVALYQLLQAERPGLGRPAFGIGAGLIGALVYPALALLWFIPSFLR